MKGNNVAGERSPSDLKLEELQTALNYRFQDRTLLEVALTHRSLSRNSNERLEFLGDAVLNAAIAHYLFGHYADAGEGQLSYIRSSLVNKQSLLDIAAELNLADYMRYARAFARMRPEEGPPSLLADALEAIIGAIYLDGGWEKCLKSILELYQSKLNNIDLDTSYKDVKTYLQELMQARYGKIPSYKLVSEEGLPHKRRFVVTCTLPDKTQSTGEGSSMKRAEKAAAGKALATLTK